MTTAVRRAVLALLLIVPALAAAEARPPRVTAGELTRGERLFQDECASCHGPGGEGGRGAPLAVPRLTRAADFEGLTKLIKGGVEGTEMPAARLDGEQVKMVAAWVLRLGRRPAQRVPGDRVRGEALFRGKGGCVLCHAVGGRGGTLGPELSEVGLRRGAAYLRAALLDPEADVPRSSISYRADVNLTQNFLAVRVVTADHREVAGVRVNEDTFSIQIRDVSGAVHSFWKAELAELHKEWGRSPMPSYRDALDEAAVDDLVAFMAGLRGSP